MATALTPQTDVTSGKSHVTDGEPETVVSASLQKIKLIKNPINFFFYFIKSETSDSFVSHFDGHFAYLKTLDFYFNVSLAKLFLLHLPLSECHWHIHYHVGELIFMHYISTVHKLSIFLQKQTQDIFSSPNISVKQHCPLPIVCTVCICACVCENKLIKQQQVVTSYN